MVVNDDSSSARTKRDIVTALQKAVGTRSADGWMPRILDVDIYFVSARQITLVSLSDDHSLTVSYLNISEALPERVQLSKQSYESLLEMSLSLF